eukprot:9141643-Lingulodinium_polyedra.AAC.1
MPHGLPGPSLQPLTAASAARNSLLTAAPGELQQTHPPPPARRALQTCGCTLAVAHGPRATSSRP